MGDTRYPQAIAPRGMVASGHYLASQAGVWMLRQGGNAIDAAVCAAATIAVVAPHLNGTGGDLFAQVWSPGSSEPVGLNASGRSSKKASIEEMNARGHSAMPLRGALTITVPGAVSGWSALLERYGTLRLYDVLEPAIDYAEHGTPVTAKLAGAISSNLESICADPGFRSVFTRDGVPLGQGDLFVNRELADSLAEIGRTDGQSFYGGDLAVQMAKGIQAAGGLIQADDLAEHQPEWVTPLQSTFLGRTVFELPPNSQGVTALEMLNMAERSRANRLAQNSCEYITTLTRVVRLAYEDRDKYVSDPAFGDIPLQKLMSKAYAESRLMEAPASAQISESGDTIYLCVVDSKGMSVSLIQSHYMGFGSFVMAAGTGIHFQNRGAYFSLDPSHVNRLEPSKRTMHTLIPAMVGNNGHPEIVLGSMGGDSQPQFHLQVLLNHLAFGMEAQAAIEAPRFSYLIDAQRRSRTLLESRIPPSTVEALLETGGDVLAVEDWSSSMGHAQMIRIDRESGLLFGGADPRGDGQALGY